MLSLLHPAANHHDRRSARGRACRARPRRNPALEALEGRALPSTWTVDRLDDSDAGGTLRWAVAQADADPDPAGAVVRFDPTVFSTNQIITLTSPLVLSQAAGPIAIEGPGAALLTVSGGDAVQVFRVDAGATASISGLTITGGRDTTGGGISNSGTLTVARATISGNRAVGADADNSGDPGFGGGIYNVGTLMISDVEFLDNAATGGRGASGGGAYGGAIYSAGSVTMVGGRFEGNTAFGMGGTFGGGVGCGGGIYNTGTLTISRVVFEENSTNGAGGAITGQGYGNDGGAIANTGSLTLFDASLVGNSAVNGGGGAISSSGTLNLSDVRIANSSAGDGGGVGNSGTATIRGCTLSSNRAYGVPASRYGNRRDSTGGGIANSGSMTIMNSTITGNTAADFNGQARGRGGGIGNLGMLQVLFSTIADNTADEGGGLWTSGIEAVTTSGAGLYRNASGRNIVVVEGGVFRSLGHNLFSDAPDAPTGPTDLIAVDPMLGPLADNGGPTPTMALLPGSPALDAGGDVAGVAVDQRGVPRPQGDSPDVGAFELRGMAPSFTLLASPTIVYGAATVSLSGRIAAGDQIPPGVVAVTLDGDTRAAAIDPATGAFAVAFPVAGLHVAPSPYAVAYRYDARGEFLAADAAGTLAVTPAPLTVIADDRTVPFGRDIPPLAATYLGLVGGDGPADLTRPATLSTVAVAYSLPGRYAIVASGAESADYAIAYVDGVLTVAEPAGRRARGGSTS